MQEHDASPGRATYERQCLVLLTRWWNCVQNPLSSSIQQPKPIIFKASVSKSSVLIKLCEAVVAFSFAIGQSSLEVGKDLVSPFHEGFS